MENSNTTIQSSCRVILRPLASIFLRCGLTWKEFSDLAKSVFVQAATEEYGIKGRPTNVSRVSILTGISRKEVKRQRVLPEETSVAKGKTTDATRVLSGWHQDPIYLSVESAPRTLPERGTEPSFETLCTRYGGDISATTLLKELLKTQAVERTADGQLRALKRYYQPAAHDDELLLYASSRIKDLAETMNNNLFPDKMNAPRFEGYADNDRIAPDMVPKFREFLDKRGQAFLEEIDDWLTEHAADDNNTTDRIRLGIGLYAIEDNKIMEKSK